MYKAELRRQQRLNAAEKSAALGDKLMDKDFVGFWKGWRRTSHTQTPPVNRIGDAITEHDIAGVFQSYFQGIFGENGTDSHRALQREFSERFPSYSHDKQHESIAPYFLTWDDMVEIAGKLKRGKSSNSHITAEHILYGSEKLMVHLHILFNAFIQHSYVPVDFLKGTISPIVKDSSGDLNAVGNYRGVTLCSVFSLMFENALRLKFHRFLSSDALQFGFKPRHSTSHAVYTLKATINHFIERDSNVFVAFLDFSKAFDTISHSGLFLKLMDRNVPVCFLLLIIFWYGSMEYMVKWSNVYSESFHVLCGTKQGGVLSPEFFAVYIDDLISVLRKTGVGCYVVNLFIACLLFADDVTLLAPTRSALQRLINVCASYCHKFCLKFNAGKTKVMVYGKMSRNLPSLSRLIVNDQSIDYVEACRYLGFYLTSGVHFRFSINEDLRGFFGSVNSILSSVQRPKENVLMQLLYSNCVPKLTYGAAVKDLNANETNQINVALNNAIRRIFGFRQWQSIRQIRQFYQYDAIEIMFAKAKRRFNDSLSNHHNTVLRFLYSSVAV